MIINTEREPLYSLYFLGGVIIDILKSTQSETLDSLYLKFQKNINKSIHIDFFYYALDWLYILSIVEIKDGVICILKD